MISLRAKGFRDQELAHRFPEVAWDHPVRVRWLDQHHGAVIRFACPFCLYRGGLARPARRAPLWGAYETALKHLALAHFPNLAKPEQENDRDDGQHDQGA